MERTILTRPYPAVREYAKRDVHFRFHWDNPPTKKSVFALNKFCGALSRLIR
jgi:hypothetical protein